MNKLKILYLLDKKYQELKKIDFYSLINAETKFDLMHGFVGNKNSDIKYFIDADFENISSSNFNSNCIVLDEISFNKLVENSCLLENKNVIVLFYQKNIDLLQKAIEEDYNIVLMYSDESKALKKLKRWFKDIYDKNNEIYKYLNCSIFETLNKEENFKTALLKLIPFLLEIGKITKAYLCELKDNTNYIETIVSFFNTKELIVKETNFEINEYFLKIFSQNKIQIIDAHFFYEKFSFLQEDKNNEKYIAIPINIIGKLKSFILIPLITRTSISDKQIQQFEYFYKQSIPMLTKIYYSNALSETLYELNSIFENTSVGIILLKDRKIVKLNSKFLSILGYSWSEAKDMEIFQLFDDVNNAKKYLLDNLLNNIKEKGTIEYQFNKKDNSSIWCQISGRFLVPNNPKMGTVWIIDDISKRKETEINNIKNKQQLEAFLSALPDRILIINKYAQIIDMHHRLHIKRKQDFTKYIGQDLSKIMPLQRKEKIMNAFKKCITNNKLQIVEYSFLKNNSRKYFEARIAPLDITNTKIDQAVVLIRDITARSIIQLELVRLNKTLEYEVKKRAEKIIELNKNAIIGDLVSGFVHNLRSPLSVILGKIDLILFGLKKIKDADKLKAHIHKNATGINTGVQRIESMLKNLMIKKRSDSIIDKTDLNLNEFLHQEVEFLQADMKFKHETTKEFDLTDNLPKVSVISAEISQVLYNIINNAIDAMWMQKEKQLTFKTKYDEASVSLILIDNGPGIPLENMDKLFNPFYTTKPEKSSAKTDEPVGTGLGLHSALQMMKSNNGTIKIFSQLGVGTTVELYFSR